MDKRVHATLNNRSAELIDELGEQGYKPREVLVEALSLLDYAIKEAKAGRDFGSLSNDGRTMNNVVTPILQGVKATSTTVTTASPAVAETVVNTSADDEPMPA